MLAAVDSIVSPLGTPGAKRGRGEFHNTDSETLMVEGSPSPGPDREQSGLVHERMKRQRLCEGMGDGILTRGDSGLGLTGQRDVSVVRVVFVAEWVMGETRETHT